jgi:hypothetical protein
LRTQIQQLTQQKGWNTVMITSPQPGEGKVVQEGRTSMRAVQKALKLIPKEKFLGFVINRQKGIPDN